MRTTRARIEAVTISGLRGGALHAQSSDTEPADIVILAEAPEMFPYNGLPRSPGRMSAGSGLHSGEASDERVTSSCGDSEGRVSETASPSPRPADDCSQLVHELSNLMSGVLLNAQMLEWKLPPYSHLKRPIREVARNAQRAAELMKRLQRRWSEGEPQARPNDLTQACDQCTSNAFPKRDDRDGR